MHAATSIKNQRKSLMIIKGFEQETHILTVDTKLTHITRISFCLDGNHAYRCGSRKQTTQAKIRISHQWEYFNYKTVLKHAHIVVFFSFFLQILTVARRHRMSNTTHVAVVPKYKETHKTDRRDDTRRNKQNSRVLKYY